MIKSKLRSYRTDRGLLRIIRVEVRKEFTGDGTIPLSPIDIFPTQLPELTRGKVRTLYRAKTTKKGTVLFAVVVDK